MSFLKLSRLNGIEYIINTKHIVRIEKTEQAIKLELFGGSFILDVTAKEYDFLLRELDAKSQTGKPIAVKFYEEDKPVL